MHTLCITTKCLLIMAVTNALPRFMCADGTDSSSSGHTLRSAQNSGEFPRSRHASATGPGRRVQSAQSRRAASGSREGNAWGFGGDSRAGGDETSSERHLSLGTFA